MIRSPAFRLKKHSETQIVAKIAKSGKSNREWEQGYSDTLLDKKVMEEADVPEARRPLPQRETRVWDQARGPTAGEGQPPGPLLATATGVGPPLWRAVLEENLGLAAGRRSRPGVDIHHVVG